MLKIQNLKKNVLWHILAPSAVACDNLHLRASAHLRRVSAFLCNREFLGISYYIKKAHPDGCALKFKYSIHYFFCKKLGI